MARKEDSASTQLVKSSSGIELALSVMIFSLLGLWIDTKLDTRPLFMLIFFIVSVVASGFTVYYRAKAQYQLDDESDGETK